MEIAAVIKERGSQGLNESRARGNVEEVLVLQVGGEDSVAFGSCLNKYNEEKVESKHKSSFIVDCLGQGCSQKQRQGNQGEMLDKGQKPSPTIISCLLCIIGKLLTLNL